MRRRVLAAVGGAVVVLALGAGPAAAGDPHQVDMRIGKDKGAQTTFKGDDVYNLGQKNQTVTIRKKPGKTARFRAVIQNDGVVSNFLSLLAKSGNGKFKVTYRDLPSLTDITATVTGADGLIYGPTPAGFQDVVLVEIKVKGKAKPGNAFTAKLTGQGHDNPTAPPPVIPPVLTIDGVKAKVKVK